MSPLNSLRKIAIELYIYIANTLGSTTSILHVNYIYDDSTAAAAAARK